MLLATMPDTRDGAGPAFGFAESEGEAEAEGGCNHIVTARLFADRIAGNSVSATASTVDRFA